MSRASASGVRIQFPVENPVHKASVVHALRAMFRDNTKGRTLNPDGTYSRVQGSPSEPYGRAQALLQVEAKRRETQAIDRAGVTFRP